MLYKLDLNLVCGRDKTLVCDHSNESYSAVHSCGTVYYAVQGKTLVSDHSKGRCLAVFSYGSVTPAVQGACCFRLFKPPILLQSKRKLYSPVELSYKPELRISILGENVENYFVYRTCSQTTACYN